MADVLIWSASWVALLQWWQLFSAFNGQKLDIVPLQKYQVRVSPPMSGTSFSQSLSFCWHPPLHIKATFHRAPASHNHHVYINISHKAFYCYSDECHWKVHPAHGFFLVLKGQTEHFHGYGPGAVSVMEFMSDGVAPTPGNSFHSSRPQCNTNLFILSLTDLLNSLGWTSVDSRLACLEDR